MANKWDRLQDEPDDAWKAFQTYLQGLPGQRRVKGLGADAPNWYTKYSWRTRAAEHDKHINAIVSQEKGVAAADPKLAAAENAIMYSQVRGKARAMIAQMTSEDTFTGGPVRVGDLQKAVALLKELDDLTKRQASFSFAPLYNFDALTPAELRVLENLHLKMGLNKDGTFRET